MKLATKAALLVSALTVAGAVSAGPTLQQIPPVMATQDKQIVDAKLQLSNIKVYSNAEILAKAKSFGLTLPDNSVLTPTTLTVQKGIVTDKAWLRLTGNGTVSFQDNLATMGTGAIHLAFKAEANKRYLVDFQAAVIGFGSGTIQVKVTYGRGAQGPTINTTTSNIASDGHYTVLFQPLATADLEWAFLETTAGGWSFKQVDIVPL